MSPPPLPGPDGLRDAERRLLERLRGRRRMGGGAVLADFDVMVLVDVLEALARHRVRCLEDLADGTFEADCIAADELRERARGPE